MIFPENESVNLKRVEELLKGDNYSLVSCVHCETSSGVFNPVEQVGQLVKSLSPGTLGREGGRERERRREKEFMCVEPV